jgi:hypothetical protein
VDAVGVCERHKSDSRPLEQKKTVPLNKLLEAVAMGMQDSDALSSLAVRLIRLEKRLDRELQTEVKNFAAGMKLSQIAQDLLHGIDPDFIQAKAKEGKPEGYESTEELLKAACGGRLVPTEVELARQEGRAYESGSEPLNNILQRRRRIWDGTGKYKEPIGPPASNLWPLPDRWTWATPDQVALSESNAICAGPFGTIFKAKGFRSEGVPIIFLRHVGTGQYLTHKPGFMDRKKWDELFRPYSLYGGELLITKLGEPPGACTVYPTGIGPAMLTPDVIKLSVNEPPASSKFLMYYFNCEVARGVTTGVAFGATRLRLTLPSFRGMPIRLPPIAEQQRIVEEVERRLSVIKALETTVATNLRRAERFRHSILHRAFSGHLSLSRTNLDRRPTQ